MTRSFIISILLAALLLSGLIYFLYSQNADFDWVSLLIGNSLLALMSLGSFRIISKGIKSENHNAFVRAKYGAMMMKFFVGLATLLIYIFAKNKEIHKPSLFLFLGMYVVYSALEAIPLSQSAKKN